MRCLLTRAGGLTQSDAVNAADHYTRGLFTRNMRRRGACTLLQTSSEIKCIRCTARSCTCQAWPSGSVSRDESTRALRSQHPKKSSLDMPSYSCMPSERPRLMRLPVLIGVRRLHCSLSPSVSPSVDKRQNDCNFTQNKLCAAARHPASFAEHRSEPSVPSACLRPDGPHADTTTWRRTDAQRHHCYPLLLFTWRPGLGCCA